MSVEPTPPRVIACYAVLDRFMPACGFPDLTDGIYSGQADDNYEAAQSRQASVLLDRARCDAGGRLLEIGSGYGRILRAAQDRGATATGLTVSPEQVRHGRRTGLDVQLLDYKHLDQTWNAGYDAVIANGSLEHFAQAEDAAAGRDDAIYRHLFQTVHRVLKAGRFVTTAIHFRHRPDPNDLLRPPSAFPRGSDPFHWSRLAHAFAGWYPMPGQLERCAHGLFELVHEEDGTDDYRRTSEEWLIGVRRILYSPRGLGITLRCIPLALRHPVQLKALLQCMLGSESWNWQFRGNPTPALLLRQTWQWRPKED